MDSDGDQQLPRPYSSALVSNKTVTGTAVAHLVSSITLTFLLKECPLDVASDAPMDQQIKNSLYNRQSLITLNDEFPECLPGTQRRKCFSLNSNAASPVPKPRSSPYA